MPRRLHCKMIGMFLLTAHLVFTPGAFVQALPPVLTQWTIWNHLWEAVGAMTCFWEGVQHLQPESINCKIVCPFLYKLTNLPENFILVSDLDAFASRWRLCGVTWKAMPEQSCFSKLRKRAFSGRQSWWFSFKIWVIIITYIPISLNAWVWETRCMVLKCFVGSNNS